MVTHTGFLPFSKIIGPLLGPWMLPIFAYLGGSVLYTKDSALITLQKRGKVFIRTYILAGSLSLIGWYFFLRNYYPMGALHENLGGQLQLFFLGKSTVFNGPLWFFPCYFLSLCITFFLLNFFGYKKRSYLWGVSSFLFFLGIVLLQFHIIFPFSCDIAILFSSLMLFGYLTKRKKVSNTFFILSCGSYVVLSYMNGTTDLNQRLIGNPSLYGGGVATGIVSLIFIFQFIEARFKKVGHILAKIGKHSLVLLSIHWPILQFGTYVLFLTGLLMHLGVEVFTITSFELPQMQHIRFFVLGFLSYYLFFIYVGYIIISQLKITYNEWHRHTI